VKPVTAAVVLATTLIAGGRPLPTRTRRYLIIWAKSSAKLLDKYKVKYEKHVYHTTVEGEKYTRYKLVVRDVKATRILAKLAKNKTKLKRVLKRYENVVKEVLQASARHTGWRTITNYIPSSRLRRWFGIRPFDYFTYEKHRNRAIVKLLKPDWRGWLYRRLLKAGQFRTGKWWL